VLPLGVLPLVVLLGKRLPPHGRRAVTTPCPLPPAAQWARVARDAALVDRRPLDCRARWLQQLAPGASTQWSEQELARLKELVGEHGGRSWRKVGGCGCGGMGSGFRWVVVGWLHGCWGRTALTGACVKEDA
jgi:hypothetical protein